jgi:hypothetical protein
MLQAAQRERVKSALDLQARRRLDELEKAREERVRRAMQHLSSATPRLISKPERTRWATMTARVRPSSVRTVSRTAPASAP